MAHLMAFGWDLAKDAWRVKMKANTMVPYLAPLMD